MRTVGDSCSPSPTLRTSVTHAASPSGYGAAGGSQMMSVLVNAPDSTGNRILDSVLPAHAAKRMQLFGRPESSTS